MATEASVPNASSNISRFKALNFWELIWTPVKNKPMSPTHLFSHAYFMSLSFTFPFELILTPQAETSTAHTLTSAPETDWWTSDLQGWKKINVCCFRLPHLWSLLTADRGNECTLLWDTKGILVLVPKMEKRGKKLESSTSLVNFSQGNLWAQFTWALSYHNHFCLRNVFRFPNSY